MQHSITYEQASKYPHLVRGHCSCGWHAAGYATEHVAPVWANRHLMSVAGRAS